jgi:DNA-binding transcriptional ArsR family regulator
MARKAPDPVFRAVADPTRRAILDLLTTSERAVKELTAAFSISPPAISRHLQGNKRIHRKWPRG